MEFDPVLPLEIVDNIYRHADKLTKIVFRLTNSRFQGQPNARVNQRLTINICIERGYASLFEDFYKRNFFFDHKSLALSAVRSGDLCTVQKIFAIPNCVYDSTTLLTKAIRTEKVEIVTFILTMFEKREEKYTISDTSYKRVLQAGSLEMLDLFCSLGKDALKKLSEHATVALSYGHWQLFEHLESVILKQPECMRSTIYFHGQFFFHLANKGYLECIQVALQCKLGRGQGSFLTVRYLKLP